MEKRNYVEPIQSVITYIHTREGKKKKTLPHPHCKAGPKGDVLWYKSCLDPTYLLYSSQVLIVKKLVLGCIIVDVGMRCYNTRIKRR